MDEVRSKERAGLLINGTPYLPLQVAIGEGHLVIMLLLDYNIHPSRRAVHRSVVYHQMEGVGAGYCGCKRRPDCRRIGQGNSRPSGLSPLKAQALAVRIMAC
ncbi:MAG: hypothetical protein DDT27_00668 [Dehalococcoidia bacterium]|nr:hypothetical protein [Chloroflexota bacterium]